MAVQIAENGKLGHVSIFYSFRGIASYLSKVADFDPPHLYSHGNSCSLSLAPPSCVFLYRMVAPLFIIIFGYSA